MRKRIMYIILIITMATCQIQTFGQNPGVTGRIVGPDNAPVSGASITVSGSSQGTTTDENGNFSIAVPPAGSLMVNSIGFSEQVVKVDGRTVINVTLSSGQSTGLEEVVVTGYTTQKRKDIVGSVAVVDMKAMKSVPANSVMQALQGQAAGVDVINSGSPGQSSSIFIRGITSFNTNPLVLIDGIQGQINDIPSNDVESIQVLKDAGSASIYGTRAANGVIVVTTKKGKTGRTSVTYDSYFNLQIPRSGKDLNLLNAQEYATMWAQLNPGTALFPGGVIPDYIWRSSPTNRGIGNEGDAVVDPSKYNFDPQDFNKNYNITKLVKQGATDMYGEIMNPALMMNHSITASGASDKANYLLAFGYQDHQGTMMNTELKRYTLRINTQYKLSKNIRLGENVNMMYKNNPRQSANGTFGPLNEAYNWLPFLPVYDIGGNFAGPFSGPGISDMGDWSNPKADLHFTNNNRRREYSMAGNAYLEIDFLKNFTARSSFGGSINNYYTQAFLYNSYWTSSGGNNTNTSTENSGYYTTAQWTNSLAYKNNWKKHNLAVLAGSESIENMARSMTSIGQNFFSTDYNYLILNNASVRQPPTSGATEDALFSLFGDLKYSYDDKYLLSVTVRRDGFSAFGKDKKYGVFPAVAVGWRISQENFMKNVAWVSDLKIRASYGVLGSKEGINPTNSYTTYGQGPRDSYYDIQGTGNSIVQGFFPQQNGNTFTSWERDIMTNVGIDATLFNNHLDLSVEYYEKRVNGLLRQVGTPATAGEASPPFVNIGDVQNRGVDLSVMYRASIGKDLRIGVGANLTAYKNKIISLPAPNYFDEAKVRNEVGHPISSFFGYQIVGLFQSQEEVEKSPTQDQAEPGRFKYLDADRNGVIDQNDRVHFGDPNPDFTLGLNLNAIYKGFDFSAVLYTSQGQDVYNNTYEFTGDWARGVGNKSRRVLDAWTPDHTNTKVQKNELNRTFSTTSVNNSAFMEDGSFIRLRSVQLGYNLPVKPFRNIGIGLNNLRVYVQGTNLFLISNYTGLDPEVSGSTVQRGIDTGAYVQEKGVAVGLNVTF
jgi:TonB-linked SusC/RagA family outer membrane protein